MDKILKIKKLNCHPDVKAAVLVAGFDRSADLFEQQGEAMIGSGIRLFMPYVSLYERLKFGKYASYSAIEGFAGSQAERRHNRPSRKRIR